MQEYRLRLTRAKNDILEQETQCSDACQGEAKQLGGVPLVLLQDFQVNLILRLGYRHPSATTYFMRSLLERRLTLDEDERRLVRGHGQPPAV